MNKGDMNSSSGLTGKLIGFILVVLFARFSYRLYQVRMRTRRLVTVHGIKIMPHSFLFGHLPVLGKIMAKYPSDTAGQIVPILLTKEYPELRDQGLIYMDIWPIQFPLLAVFNPDMLAQFCQEPSMPKPKLLHAITKDFTDCQDILSSNGSEWKRWRTIFNPGFSSKNVLSLVPGFVEEVQVFKDVLADIARSGRTVEMIQPLAKATCDIISRAVLGVGLGIQTSESRFFKALKEQLKWITINESPLVLLRRVNPLRRLFIWNNNRILREELIPHIQQQLESAGRTQSFKTINSLAIMAFLEDKDLDAAVPPSINASFLDMALAQIKIFMVAGHDTTASTLCYVYYCLHRHPEIAERVRKEHDVVFGRNASRAGELVTAEPALLNQLAYTTCCIKETLRLYPPIASVRSGSSSLYLTNPKTNQRFPTEDWTIMSTSHALHRMEEYWEEAESFKPERWLAREGEPLYPTKNAYRPFELGPRNCIGQDLALTEMKLILAMTVREFDVVPQYADDATRLFGEPAYQAVVADELTNHPKDGMPVKIKLRQNE